MNTAAFAPHRISRLRALHDWVLVEDMNFDERITTSGIILTSDDGKGTGIRPRWGRVYATGPKQHDVHVGQSGQQLDHLDAQGLHMLVYDTTP